MTATKPLPLFAATPPKLDPQTLLLSPSGLSFLGLSSSAGPLCSLVAKPRWGI